MRVRHHSTITPQNEAILFHSGQAIVVACYSPDHRYATHFPITLNSQKSWARGVWPGGILAFFTKLFSGIWQRFLDLL